MKFSKLVDVFLFVLVDGFVTAVDCRRQFSRLGLRWLERLASPGFGRCSFLVELPRDDYAGSVSDLGWSWAPNHLEVLTHGVL